jgi:D-glycero-alpha-D-manno-heptose 1-phosphate guanylyltransferase
MAITAVILAGGMGTRLREVVPDLPKALVPVRGRPFLSYLLEQVESAGLVTAVLCIGYEGREIQKVFGRYFEGLELFYSQEEQPLGTAGALRAALPLVKTAWWLVMNGDSYCHVDLSQFDEIAILEERPSIILTQVQDTSRYGQVVLDDDDRIVRFEEKRQQGSAGWINAGIYLLPLEYINEIPAGREVSLEKEMFPLWIQRGLFGIKSTGAFIDIGTPDSYTDAKRFFQELK